MRLAPFVLTGTIVTALAGFAFYQGGDAPQAPLMTAAIPATEQPETAQPEVEPVSGTLWNRPPGPMRVALQAGHWKSSEAPEEQSGLRTNGTFGGGKAEWEVNLGIARRTAAILEQEGYLVEVLPTTIPPGYWADLFISIHADGSPSSSISGFRAAAPRRDQTGRAADFVQLLESSYGAATGLPHYPNVTRRMTGYYAFNYRRYEHALHPMTVGVILETGFLSSPRDRGVIVNAPDRAARGIADAAIRYLEAQPLNPPPRVIATPIREPRMVGARWNRDRGDNSP